MTEPRGPTSPEARLAGGTLGQAVDFASAPRRSVAASLRWGVFGLLLFGLVWTHQRFFEAPTPVSRLDLLRALVLHGEVCIDRYHTNTLDKAVWGGHFYSDKAPGTVVLASPGFAIAAAVVSLLGLDVDVGPGALVCSWVASASSNGLVAAAGGVALWLWLMRFVAPRTALVTVLALFLGAAPLPYSTMLFSHAMVVGLVAIALEAIQRQADCGGDGPSRGLSDWFKANRWVLLAGHACGWALASEYSAGLVVVGLGLWVMGSGWRRLVAFWLGALPPLLLIPAYSWACFGDPLVLPYSVNPYYPEMKEGLYAIKWPDLQTAFRLLFSPTRGLLFWSPFVAMAWLGYGRLMRVSGRLFWLCYSVPVLQVLAISGRSWNWEAGPALGPRFLSPMLPLLALPCALGLERFPKLGAVLAVWSMGVTTVATLTDACPWPEIANPLVELHLPRFLRGELSPNLGLALGLGPPASVAAYYAVLAGGVAWLWHRLPAGCLGACALKDLPPAEP